MDNLFLPTISDLIEDMIVPGGIAPEVQELKPLYPNYAPGIKRTKV